MAKFNVTLKLKDISLSSEFEGDKKEYAVMAIITALLICIILGAVALMGKCV